MIAEDCGKNYTIAGNTVYLSIFVGSVLMRRMKHTGCGFWGKSTTSFRFPREIPI